MDTPELDPQVRAAIRTAGYRNGWYGLEPLVLEDATPAGRVAYLDAYEVGRNDRQRHAGAPYDPAEALRERVEDARDDERDAVGCDS